MRRLLLSLAVSAVLAAALPAPIPAHAQDVVTAAQDEFKKGRDAFKQGDFTAARALFQKSFDLHPTPGAVLNLALCEEQLGLIATAWQRFQELTEQVPSTDERYTVAKQHAAALQPRLPKLRIELSPDVPAGTSVRRDSIAVAGTSLGVDLPVDPGKHTVTVSAPGRDERRYDVTLEEGKRQTLKVEPGPQTAAASTASGVPTATASATATTPPTVTALPPPSNNRRLAGLVIGGAGVAGLIVGGITGGLTFAKTGEVEKACPIPDDCTTEGLAIADSARTFGLVSTISFIAGGALVGTGVVLVLTSKSSPATQTALSPLLLPGGGGLSARGRF